MSHRGDPFFDPEPYEYTEGTMSHERPHSNRGEPVQRPPRPPRKWRGPDPLVILGIAIAIVIILLVVALH